MRPSALLSCATGALLTLGPSAAPALAQSTTARVSVSTLGVQGNHISSQPSMSADGRRIAFQSFASNLVPGDTNGAYDIFVYDRDTGTTNRVSVTSTGQQANGPSSAPRISGDGRFVCFMSEATNLVPPDANGARADVFRHDLETGETILISVDNNGAQPGFQSTLGAVSHDGSLVAFYSASPLDANFSNAGGVFVRNIPDAVTSLVSLSSDGSPGNGLSFATGFSEDKRFLTIDSLATNLVEDDTNGKYDVFVRDLELGLTTCMSRASTGEEADADTGNSCISADGRFVAFTSIATNLVPNDANLSMDVFVRDRLTGAIERVSLSTAGAEGNHWSELANISADGRFVVFHSSASNLVPNDSNGGSDVFLRDRLLNRTARVSIVGANAQASDGSSNGRISADGRWIAFGSASTNLVPGDTNNWPDIFLRHRSCLADANGDRWTDFLDLNLILSNFSLTVPPNTMGDVNNDGVVNMTDLNLVLSSMGESC